MQIMNTGNSLLYFIAGAVTGAALAFFMFSDSTKHTRDKVRRTVADVAGRAKDEIAESLDIIEQALEEK